MAINPSSNNISLHYLSYFQGKAVAPSRQALLAWWKDMKNTEPFCYMVADRDDSQSENSKPYYCFLRVKLEYENKDRTIDHFFTTHNITWTTGPVMYSEEKILANLDTTYEIEGVSYQIKRRIGSGGCGHVYLAIDTESKKEVAIKVLLSGADKEHRNLHKLQSKGPNPYVVQYYGCATFMNKTWIAMEYIKGTTRRAYEKTHAWTPELEKQYQSGLSFVYQCGIKRDTENIDENIMIEEKEGKTRVVLIDFSTNVV